MPTQVFGKAGLYNGRQVVPLNIYTNRSTARYAPSFYFFDGVYARDPDNTPTSLLRAGLIVGKISTSGEGGGYANSIIGVTQAAYTSGGLALTVTAAQATELVRRIGASGTFKLAGGTTATASVSGTTTVTYSAVDTTTGIITISDIGANRAAGAAVQPHDGSETALTIYDNEYGTDVTDVNANNIQQPMHSYVIGGDFFSAMIINLTAVNAGVQAYLKTLLRANGGTFTFDDDK